MHCHVFVICSPISLQTMKAPPLNEPLKYSISLHSKLLFHFKTNYRRRSDNRWWFSLSLRMEDKQECDMTHPLMLVTNLPQSVSMTAITGRLASHVSDILQRGKCVEPLISLVIQGPDTCVFEVAGPRGQSPIALWVFAALYRPGTCQAELIVLTPLIAILGISSMINTLPTTYDI